MLHIQTIARVMTVGTYVVSAVLAGVMLGGARPDSGELAALHVLTVVALLVGCLAGAVGFISRARWASVARFLGLGLCMTFSAISTDSDLSGDSGQHLAVLAGVLGWAGLVLTFVSLAPSRE